MYMSEKCYQYYKYSDLDCFKRMKPVPKRCAESTPHGIPCEYYTVPRTVQLPPAGYTSYTTYIRYDVNRNNKLVRIALRVPRYKDQKGQICIENFDIISTEYTDAALRMLHTSYCNPNLTFDVLSHSFPLGKNASKKALELLLPWAHENHIFPDYPTCCTHLWFYSLRYKTSVLTFCLNFSRSQSEPTIFDILIDNNFFSLRKLQRQKTTVDICINANYALYEELHEIFPNANFCFDIFQLPDIYYACIKTLSSADKLRFTSIQRDIKRYLQNISAFDDNICISAISTLLNYRHTDISEINMFRNNLESIMRDEPNFINNFFLIKKFHNLLPMQLNEIMQPFFKHRGYDTSRLLYMALSSITHDHHDIQDTPFHSFFFVHEAPTYYGLDTRLSTFIQRIMRYASCIQKLID